MLPAEERLSDARRLIDWKRYFVLNAPRQTGKSTTVAALAANLNASGRYTALLTSCEEADPTGEDINRGIASILQLIQHSGRAFVRTTASNVDSDRRRCRRPVPAHGLPYAGPSARRDPSSSSSMRSIRS